MVLQNVPMQTVHSEEVRRDFAGRALHLTNNSVLDALPKDSSSNTCLPCNFHSTWISQGGDMKDELLAGEYVHAHYLEYDTDRAGDFKPLASG